MSEISGVEKDIIKHDFDEYVRQDAGLGNQHSFSTFKKE
jgi:hypothetical protein